MKAKMLRAIAKNLLPPIVIYWLRRLINEKIGLVGRYDSWSAAMDDCTGYDAREILDKVLAATLKVKNGEAKYERDSVIFDEIVYAWPVLSGLVLAAARNCGKLSVLDYGGSLGSSYFQNKKFLNLLPVVTWSVVEQEHYVKAGHKYIQDECLHFYTSIESCVVEASPNVILLSSVLQYLPDPYSILKVIGDIKADVLVIDRTSFLISDEKDVIKMQHVPEVIYKASYPCRVFNEKHFTQYITDLGYKLIERFESLDNFDKDTRWYGYIFVRQADV